ncbi:unnamed protein product (macronuclear) [Paramecium tetraurelia]|uniref:Prenyltransferase alpha-alpha toroid domain-containing protein n=1 Tax=Paramecium tetraurelia TaxID=5888 RepID=A0DAT9_PARTE|nr:uncharacterized protein GSPATT00015063001 [Paramecium tetraurelia]CAK80156.1 unnamed protein product [Paramecium tetraurelia]|eukprot:XP_001447553.1 hypothetical protein (macronuclear) [Paramecium tetraurelia strain d4-2]
MQQQLTLGQHEVFVQKTLYEQKLPYKADSLKALFLYCCVTTLKLLKSECQSEPIINFLKLLEVKPHQYKPSTFDDSEPSIVNSYCAISVLRELQHNIQVDQESALNFVRSLVQEDGNIRSSANSQDADIRMIYSALAYLDLLNIDTSEFQQTVGKFILMCQNQDGAFGLRPHLESHSGASYCAIASLKILKLEIPYESSLIEWLVNRQCKLTGGMAGRINKVADSCYSFWIGWTLKMLGLDLLDKERLLEFLQHCQSIYGGFSKYPQSMPDPIHTLHSLLGIMENENYDYVHAIILN